MSERPRSFDAGERRVLSAALQQGAPLHCPRCDVPLKEQEVAPGPGVPYVRHRVWLLCPRCRGSASLDRPAG